MTEFKANPTTQGVEVILQTPLGEQLPVVNRSVGNSYIANIPSVIFNVGVLQYNAEKCSH